MANQCNACFGTGRLTGARLGYGGGERTSACPDCADVPVYDEDADDVPLCDVCAMAPIAADIRGVELCARCYETGTLALMQAVAS